MSTSGLSNLFAGTDIARQIELESKSVDFGVANYRRLVADATRRGKAAQLKPVERLIVSWMPAFTDKIRELQRSYRAGDKLKGGVHWGPLLVAIRADKAAFITLDKVLSVLLESEGPVKYTSMCSSVGSAIMAQINLTNTLVAMKQAAKELDRNEARRARVQLDNLLDRSDAIVQINRQARKKHPLNFDTIASRNSIGDRLVNTLCYQVGVLPHDEDESDPDQILAFKIEKIREMKKVVRYISIRERTVEIIDSGHKRRQFLRPMYLPMLVPPYRRDRGKPGGYITIRTPFVTRSTKEQQEAYASANLSMEYDALVAIGKTPFRLNTRVHDVVKLFTEQGGGSAEVPPAYDEPKPERPQLADTDETIDADWRRLAAQWHDTRVANRAARERHGKMMLVADMFRNEERFYFPHHNCFRGRVYPIPQYLNRTGPDICRGMLLFANSVSPDAHWVAVHAANCAGYDKVSFNDRAAWARDWCADHSVGRWIGNAGSILDHMDEWASPDIDSPWQFLAALMAMHDDTMASHLPVQLDGSCNGLQHYAALTRDEQLAELVNLTDRDKPSGIYHIVANEVKRRLVADENHYAKMLLPMIDKTIVKQPTMTKWYGVTFAGARDQIKKQLEAKVVIGEHLFPASQFLTGHVLGAIGTLCGRAEAAMRWFCDSAKKMARENVAYSIVAPTGLPMIQPYRQWHQKSLLVMEGIMKIVVEDKPCPVAKGQQERGAAPNTIHMFDMSHMKMVALEDEKLGIDHAFTHDGFSCHSGNVTTFKPNVHQQFVQLHTTDWLDVIYRQWTERHPNIKFDPPPERGRFDIREVLGATYAFH